MEDFQNRRKTPRIEVEGAPIQIVEVRANYELRLIDVSLGGFLVRGPVPYPIGGERFFRFEGAPAGSLPTLAADLTARAVYSHLQADETTRGSCYLTGFSFVNPENRGVARKIDAVVERAIELQATVETSQE